MEAPPPLPEAQAPVLEALIKACQDQPDAEPAVTLSDKTVSTARAETDDCTSIIPLHGMNAEALNLLPGEEAYVLQGVRTLWISIHS